MSLMQTLETVADAVLPAFRDLTREAGALAMRYFEPGFKTSARVWSKSGGSPVTDADMAVDAFLKTRLRELLPEAGWLSEETADDDRRLGRRFVWVVDPIDGTRAFASGSLDWSVSAALLADGAPFLGIVYAPAHEVFYEACRDRGARRDAEPIATAPAPAQISVAGPMPLVDRLEHGLGPVKRVPRIPSLALRLARVADGSLDAGVVSSNAHDWDLAAADLIVHEAGGRLTGLDGTRPAYNQPEPVHGELLASARQLHPILIEAMTARRGATPAARR
jgi:myo-inositol-1(or 4)-monophosphatase